MMTEYGDIDRQLCFEDGSVLLEYIDLSFFVQITCKMLWKFCQGQTCSSFRHFLPTGFLGCNIATKTSGPIMLYFHVLGDISVSPFI